MQSNQRYFLQRVGEFEGKKAGTHTRGRNTRTIKGKTQSITSSNAKKWVMFQRLGKSRYPIQAVYVFRSQVNIPKRWKLRQQVEASVKANWHSNAAAAIKYAISTSR
jgi:hypothetical protein